MAEDNLKKYLRLLGFSPKEGFFGVWSKKYSSHGGYEILVKLKDSLKDSRIEWGDKIRADRKSTSSFSQDENLVVLECVNRLLDKGYKPESLILEKEWKLGHKGKGFLDIQVLDEEEKSFLMIECKTPGKEYDKAKKETEKDGGQLFGYFIQERNTQYLCLYASTLENKNITVFSDIIVVNEKIREAENSQEAFEAWKPQAWEKKGIFGKNDQPYKIVFEELRKDDLSDLSEDDGRKIFNRFAEILRKNVVSDKTNAFNKLFNLFLCKIVDEAENDKLKFQWRDNMESEDVMEELNDLYKKGMYCYLNLKISSVSRDQIDEKLKQVVTEQDKFEIRELFRQQKLYTGNEFAFKEVFDKKTFDENCIVVKEVVNLLENYRIKYKTKQQFLGDFFESLLNTGIKQESGQFFTPIPIAQFICKSIPIRQIIEQKNNQKEHNFLPYAIDYASGAGHFLTEFMEETENHMKGIDEDWIKGGDKAINSFLAGKRNFLWAKEYIYGIEKDYRLAKTTKISTFLNGDGDANIICGDGLDHFSKSKEYVGRLTELENKKENRQFDVLIANPPYSVDGFKNTLKHGKEAFELYPYFTDQSSEIECLFVERAKQLLRDGGVAGLILPISILSNGKIHLRAREILLKYFEIKGIVEFGSNTFMATGTKTATVFLRRRANNEWEAIESLVNDFFVNFKDVTVGRIENAFSKYVGHVFEDLELKDYISLFSDEPSERILESEIFKEHKGHFKKLKDEKLIKAIKEAEKEKMLYFMLTYNQDFVLVKSPSDNSEEKEFLGYEFSTRRGHEGIKIYKDAEGKNLTKLYNAEPEQLHDENKVNSYILKAFEGENIPEPTEELKNVLQVQKLHESLDSDRVNFEKRITTEFRKKKVDFEKIWKTSDLKSLGEIAKLQKGTSITKTKIKEGNIPVIAGGKEFAYYHNESNREGNIITVSASGANSGFVNYFDYPIFASDCTTIKPKDEKQISTKLLYWFLRAIQKEIYDLQRGQAQPHVYASDLVNIQIPLPPLDVQEKIVREMEAIEAREKEIENEARGKQEEIEGIVNSVSNDKLVKLGSIAYLNAGQSPKSEFYNKAKDGLPFYQGKIDFTDKYLKEPRVWTTQITKESIKGDILMSVRAPVGDVNINPFEKICIGRGLHAIRVNKDISQEFLWYWLKAIEKQVSSMGKQGATFNAITKDQVENIKIPLLNESEQEEIVQQIEQIEAKQAELKKELEELRASKAGVLKKYL